MRTLTFLRTAVVCSALIGTVECDALSVTFTKANETCSSGNGWVQANAFGGTAPYTYAWSTGPITPTITNLSSGWYVVTITDFIGTQLVDSTEIIDNAYLDLPGAVNQQTLHACPDQCNGAFDVHEEFINHVGNLYFSVDQGGYLGLNPITLRPMFGPYCGGEMVQVQVSDDVGCTGNSLEAIVAPLDNSPVVISQITGACGGGANGSADIGVPYDPLVSAQVTVLDAQGNYAAGPFQFGLPSLAQGLAAGHYVAERDWYGLLQPSCIDTLGFDVPDLGPDCGTVSGSVFFDHDQDCVQDANDPGIPYRILTIMPGGEYAITSANGTYDHALLYGNFTIEQPGADIQQLCPANNPAPFVLDNLNPAAVVDFADSSLIPLDLEASLHATPARPGFNFTYYGQVENMSGQVSGTLDVTFTFDPLLTFVGASPAPSSTTASSVTWTGLPAVNGFGSANISVQLSVPPDPGLIGTVLSATISASQGITETTLANNSTTCFRTITGSYDPNDKTALTSSNTSGTEYFIGLDEYIDYTIRFQNTGNDTAFTVVVTDTLEAGLDMSTFQQGLASHPFNVSFKTGRVVEWRFENILLPDSNTNEAASHGLVTFRIQPQLPLLSGSTLANAADIFFDFNPPVRTNHAVLTAQSPSAVAWAQGGDRMFLFPQPASDRLQVHLPNGTSGTGYQLLHSDGRVIRSGPLQRDGVDVSALARGAYVLAVRDNVGWHRARFVKE
ncbi:MAG: hypothetical protein ABI599_07965 [Flavobacteriales bacterium]